MTWFRMDDTWGTHPKVQACSPLARLLWVYGGLYCAQHLTDGAIPKSAMPLIVAAAGAGRKHPAELVSAGLWTDHGDEYEVNNWFEYQPSRDVVEAIREKRKTAGIEGNHQRWHVAKGISAPMCPLCNPEKDRKGDRKWDRSADSDRIPPVPSRPVPTTTNGCTNKSSSTDCPDDDDDPAVIQGREDYKRAVQRGAAITDHDAYIEACIANRRAILAQPLLPADAPRLPRPHDNCPHNCDHGWLYPNGADGGVTPCPGEAA